MKKHQDYSVRRLPGPAIRPLCEGAQTPEAHHELFRDWQRTQTQSSATVLRSPRLQIDVWFCSRAGTIGREATDAQWHILIQSMRALRARQGHLCFSLDDDLHRCGQPVSNEVVIDG